jgi:hypothetical protein
MKTASFQWSPLHVHVIGGAAMLLLTAAAHFAVVKPWLDQRHAEDRLQTRLIEQRERTQRLERSRKQLGDQLRISESQLKASPVTLTATTDLNRKLEQLSALAESAGMRLDGLDPGPVQSGTSLSTQTIQIRGKADFRGCYALLSQLRKQSPDVSVQTFLLKSLAGEEGLLSVEMELLWHALPDKSAVAQVQK